MNTKDIEIQSIDDLSAEEFIRYSRHFTLPSVGVEGQKKLKTARVLCVGAGGLGSPLLLYLAAAGVGTLGIIDSDGVELSNLQRQILYNTDDLHLSKVNIAKAKLAKLNPNIKIISYKKNLSKINALKIIENFDIVADGTDNFISRYIINDACFHLKKPYVYASVFQFEGHCSVFNAKNGPCYRCLYASPPHEGLIPNCAEAGVFGVLPGLIGTIQAIEVLKLILNIGESLIGKLLTVNTLTMQFQTFAIQGDPNCCLCVYQQPFHTLSYHYSSRECASSVLPEITVQQLWDLKQQNANYILIDVREPYEYAICHLGGRLIPLSQLKNELATFDKEQFFIVHCKTGCRSQEAVKIMLKDGFCWVKSLAGGIVAWAKEIDNTLSVY